MYLERKVQLLSEENTMLKLLNNNTRILTDSNKNELKQP